MKKQQTGFALAISLILLIILTMLGFSIANRGLLTSQIVKTSSRYETVSAAAEDEMYRLIHAMMNTRQYIPPGAGQQLVPIAGSPNSMRFKGVWSNRDLAAQFANSAGEMPSFDDFNDPGWKVRPAAASGSVNVFNRQIPSDHGIISTRAFVQQLALKKTNVSGKPKKIDVQYLITVKAFATNNEDGDNDPSNDTERETVVIQTVYNQGFQIIN